MTIITSNQISAPVGDPVTPLQTDIRSVVLSLPTFFDDALAEEVLSLSIGDMVSSSNLLLKAMYEFDLDTEVGVGQLLSLLPVLDVDIVKTVAQEIWPGYPVEGNTFDPTFARAEIRGYLLDFLEGRGGEENTEQSAAGTNPSTSSQNAASTNPTTTAQNAA